MRLVSANVPKTVDCEQLVLNNMLRIAVADRLYAKCHEVLAISIVKVQFALTSARRKLKRQLTFKNKINSIAFYKGFITVHAKRYI